jgi:RNA polymerase sigma-70 factor (ECF subfamily)
VIQTNSDKNVNLFRSLKNSDLSAFGEIYALYNRQVLNFAISFSLSRVDAEEVVQDTFVKIWIKREELDENKSVEALIFTITKNLIIDKIRKIVATKENIKSYCLESACLSANCVKDEVQFEELQTIINNAVLSLPEKRRRVFELNRFEGMTYKQIADYLNISIGTVEKQMNLALKTIKSKLTSYDILIFLFFTISFILIS